jgi:hypothetical protein
MSTNWFIGIWSLDPKSKVGLKPALLHVLRTKILQPNLINPLIVTSWVNLSPQVHSFSYLKGKDCKANLAKYLKAQEGMATLWWEPIGDLKGT